MTLLCALRSVGVIGDGRALFSSLMATILPVLSAFRGEGATGFPVRARPSAKRVHCMAGAGGGTRTPTGLSPTDFLTSYGFRRRPDRAFVVWTIPSPYLARRGVGAARLVSTPSRWRGPPGLARDCHFTGFPEFEQFYSVGFPTSTQVICLSPVRLPISPRPHSRSQL